MAAPPFLNGDPITQIETSHELSEWATNLANEMFNVWRKISELLINYDKMYY
jgi:hypothetical protein